MQMEQRRGKTWEGRAGGDRSQVLPVEAGLASSGIRHGTGQTWAQPGGSPSARQCAGGCPGHTGAWGLSSLCICYGGFGLQVGAGRRVIR